MTRWFLNFFKAFLDDIFIFWLSTTAGVPSPCGLWVDLFRWILLYFKAIIFISLFVVALAVVLSLIDYRHVYLLFVFDCWLVLVLFAADCGNKRTGQVNINVIELFRKDTVRKLQKEVFGRGVAGAGQILPHKLLRVSRLPQISGAGRILLQGRWLLLFPRLPAAVRNQMLGLPAVCWGGGCHRPRKNLPQHLLHLRPLQVFTLHYCDRNNFMVLVIFLELAYALRFFGVVNFIRRSWCFRIF